MAKIKVGDKVRMTQVAKDKYMDEEDNPHNGVGTVYKDARSGDDPTDMNDFYALLLDIPYFVTWDNGKQNAYTDEEIELVA